MIKESIPTDIATGSHKIFTVLCDSGKNPKCLKIIEREYRIIRKQRARTGGRDYCKFCQKTEEFSGRSNPNAKYHFDDNYLKYINTPEKAYLLGWIASDGSISHNMIDIAINDKDLDTLVYLKSLLDPNIPIYEKINTNIIGFRICSCQIVADVLTHLKLPNIGKKDSLVQYPSISYDLHQYFIRGYFEGDGSVSLKDGIPRINITSNSSSMLESIKDIVGYGYVYNNSYEINKGLDAISFLSFIYSDDDIPSLERKHSLYLKYSNWAPALSYRLLDYGEYKIKVNITRPNAIVPEITNTEDSGLDLHLVEKVQHLANNVDLYTTGLKLRPPPGYYFILAPRSSISKTNFSLANSLGIIDEGYSGEIMAAIRNHGTEELELPSKIIQAILIKKNTLALEVVEEFSSTTARGEGGFGSTDVTK